MLWYLFLEYIDFFENSGKQYDFKEAVDLIRFIRERYENYFSICVAGYPDCHPRSETFEKDTQVLLKKVKQSLFLNIRSIQS